jgi:hypothetical protein
MIPWRLALVSSCALVSACHLSSPGERGTAQFSWNGCLGGCAVSDSALAADGARAQIAVTLAAGYTLASVRSTNADVATFTRNGSGNLVDVVSGAAGEARLQLLDARGQLIDEAAIRVVATAQLAVTRGWSGSAPIVLAGAILPFHVVTEDGSGQLLRGTGAVAFDFAGAAHHETGITIGDEVYFSGSAGDGSIRAHTPTVTLTQPITFVGGDAITGVVASAQPGKLQSDGTFTQEVDVVANSAGGAVYGPSCAWTTSDVAVTFGASSVASLEKSAATATVFKLAQPGSFSATCIIGGVSTTVQLQR